MKRKLDNVGVANNAIKRQCMINEQTGVFLLESSCLAEYYKRLNEKNKLQIFLTESDECYDYLKKFTPTVSFFSQLDPDSDIVRLSSVCKTYRKYLEDKSINFYNKPLVHRLAEGYVIKLFRECIWMNKSFVKFDIFSAFAYIFYKEKNKKANELSMDSFKIKSNPHSDVSKKEEEIFVLSYILEYQFGKAYDSLQYLLLQLISYNNPAFHSHICDLCSKLIQKVESTGSETGLKKFKLHIEKKLKEDNISPENPLNTLLIDIDRRLDRFSAMKKIETIHKLLNGPNKNLHPEIVEQILEIELPSETESPGEGGLNIQNPFINFNLSSAFPNSASTNFFNFSSFNK